MQKRHTRHNIDGIVLLVYTELDTSRRIFVTSNSGLDGRRGWQWVDCQTRDESSGGGSSRRSGEYISMRRGESSSRKIRGVAVGVEEEGGVTEI